jgi:hypothetical protein
MFDVAQKPEWLPDGWTLLDSTDHPMFRQIYIGFPNGYALSIIQGEGTHSDASDGTVEIGYAAWDGLDKDSRALVSYEYAVDELKVADNVQGYVSIVTAVSTAMWLASLPGIDFISATAEHEYDEEPYDDDSYDEYPDDYFPGGTPPELDNAWQLM